MSEAAFIRRLSLTAELVDGISAELPWNIKVSASLTQHGVFVRFEGLRSGTVINHLFEWSLFTAHSSDPVFSHMYKMYKDIAHAEQI